MPYKNSEDQRAAAKKHYLTNRQAMIDRAAKFKKEAIKRNKAHILQYLKDHPCVDCSESNPIVLEFDHVSGEKLANITDMVMRAMSIKNINLEIAKCEVRCANCHRIKTYERSERSDRNI